MTRSEVTCLFKYNEWANLRILERASTLTARQLTVEAEVSHGSLFGTLVHVFGAESLWRQRCQQRISPVRMPSSSDFPDLHRLETSWLAEMDLMRDYVAGLRSGDLDESIEYTNTKGVPYSTPVWQILLHVINHSTQFRSEAAVLLSLAGASPGDLDLIVYLRLP